MSEHFWIKSYPEGARWDAPLPRVPVAQILDDAVARWPTLPAVDFMPLLFLCYIIAFLDRINIGYAQLQMKQTLPFSDTVYGLGAGIFFIGYFLFEVPSNLMLEKVGARKTLLRIMDTLEDGHCRRRF